MKLKTLPLLIRDMQCADCENVLEEAIAALPGIQRVVADFGNGTVTVDYDSDLLTVSLIEAMIAKAGYHRSPPTKPKNHSFFKGLALICLGLISIAGLLHLQNWLHLDLSVADLQQNFSYGLLFLIGLLTSFHCIGMCGSFVLSYSTACAHANLSPTFKHLQYGVGKTLSYSFFGAVFGGLGQIVVFTVEMRSVVAGLAGGFLILYGLSMLEAFSDFRHIRLLWPKFWTRSLILQERKLVSPLAIGLMNGLMVACGPLQAMYVLAAGTGNPWLGAKMLAVFALGTLPVMFGFGYFASAITHQASGRLLKISALIIIGLGAIMLNRGLILAGQGRDFFSLSQRVTHDAQNWLAPWQTPVPNRLLQDGYQVIYMEVDSAYHPNTFTLKSGVPVKWIVNMKDISPCNQAIVIPHLNKTIQLQSGLQLIELKGLNAGVIPWSCSMGMMQGQFQVLAN